MTRYVDGERRMPVKRLMTAALVGLVFVAACGSGKKSTSTETTTSSGAATTAAPATSAAGPLGAADPADPAKSTLKVGYIWSGVSPAVDNSADEVAADAMVKWINEYGGGIAGHPVQMVKCATNSDNSLAAACGTTFIEAKVQAVVMNTVGEVAPWATPVIAAGIPIVAFGTADPSLLPAASGGTAPANAAVFVMSNPTASISAFAAAIAKQVGAKKSVIDVIDVPAATQPAKALGPAGFAAKDAGTVTVLPISPTAPDHGPAIQAALKGNPDLVHVIGNPAYCTLSFEALRQADFKGTITGISNCLDDASRKALGSGWKGIYLSYAAGEDPANPDYIQFKAILDKYAAKKIDPSGTPVGAYVVWEAFHRLMAKATAPNLTSQVITDTIRAAKAVPMPTIPGATLTCDGKAVPALPIACTAGFTSSQMDANGMPTTFKGFAG